MKLGWLVPLLESLLPSLWLVLGVDSQNQLIVCNLTCQRCRLSVSSLAYKKQRLSLLFWHWSCLRGVLGNMSPEFFHEINTISSLPQCYNPCKILGSNACPVLRYLHLKSRVYWNIDNWHWGISNRHLESSSKVARRRCSERSKRHFFNIFKCLTFFVFCTQFRSRKH